MTHVLVVEDDESMNEVLSETLMDEDYEVQSAFSGKEAIRLFEQTEFDLVISDVRLPGMDGVETLTQLKKIRPSLKCIIITGYASADTPIRAIRLKIDDYLFKPFSLEYFLASVSRVLAREEEKASKLALVEKLFSMFGRSKDNALVEVVAERQEAFRGLYLGTRSGYLNQRSAHEVFDSLDTLEESFRTLLNSPETQTPTEVRGLQSQYTAVSNRLAKLEGGAPAQNQDLQVPAEQFHSLFEAIKSSHIGLDDLQYAPLLRNTPDNRFETLQELLDLKHRLWPDLKE